MLDLPLIVEVVPHEHSAFRLLRLNGPLTLSNLFQFQSIVRADDPRSTVVDLTAVPYVDSAGIGCLIGAHVSHQRNGRKFVLVGVCDRARDVLKITQVEGVLSLHTSVEDAVSAAPRATSA